MKYLVTGGTGFIGRHLIERLLADGHKVICLSRSKQKVQQCFGERVKAVSSLAELGQIKLDGVVNLAGEAIADQRWSEARKTLLRESRVALTAALVDWIATLDDKPEVLVSGSAIGYYGSHPGDRPLDERGGCTPGFTHELCQLWEDEAQRAEKLGVRVCCIRTGIVLGDGGALNKMLLPFRLGLGGQVGSGYQWMSWIHIDDEVDAIVMLLTHDHLQGAFNLTAPNPVTNREFAATLGKVLKRPAILPLPAFMVHLLLGEGAELLLEGQRVFPEHLLEVGYTFKYSYLQDALSDVVTTR